MSCKLYSQIEIEMKFNLGNLSRVCYVAMKADENFNISGLKMSSYLSQDQMTIKISCSRGARSALETVNEILSAVSVIGQLCELSQSDEAK
jgi:hypothetical protein